MTSSDQVIVSQDSGTFLEFSTFMITSGFMPRFNTNVRQWEWKQRKPGDKVVGVREDLLDGTTKWDVHFLRGDERLSSYRLNGTLAELSSVIDAEWEMSWCQYIGDDLCHTALTRRVSKVLPTVFTRNASAAKSAHAVSETVETKECEAAAGSRDGAMSKETVSQPGLLAALENLQRTSTAILKELQKLNCTQELVLDELRFSRIAVRFISKCGVCGTLTSQHSTTPMACPHCAIADSIKRRSSGKATE